MVATNYTFVITTLIGGNKVRIEGHRENQDVSNPIFSVPLTLRNELMTFS